MAVFPGAMGKHVAAHVLASERPTEYLELELSERIWCCIACVVSAGYTVYFRQRVGM
jgi:hypothetical protein